VILLVEDNPADVGLVRKALEEHEVGGELLVAADGEIAIQFIEGLDAQPAARPDLIIIDLSLPKRSGLEVLERLRRSAHCGQVSAVILSSSNTQQDQSDTARLGASRYISKPSRLEDFLGLGGIFKAMLGSR
jgi:chemotaxis family two-component system response regulator Rcp1